MTIKEILENIDGIQNQQIQEWLAARHYVLGRCNHLDGAKGLKIDSDKHVHVKITLDNEDDEENNSLAMAIARQVALITHYPNFKESEETTRTIISIIYKKCDSSKLKKLLKMYLGNLPDYCQFLVDGKDESLYYHTYKNYMPLDIAIEIRQEGTESFLCPKDDNKAIIKDIKMSDVLKDNSCNTPIDAISIKRSMLINTAYKTGADIDNLPAYDNANVYRYSIALDCFFNHSSEEYVQNKWDKAKVMDKLSCLFCADCMNERLDGLFDTHGLTMVQYIKKNKKDVIKTIQENIDALALCEHSRWNVEKLLLGFRPYSILEQFTIESLFGDAKKNYRRKLKDKGVHLDLCSYPNLRRIDPGNIKYDYFLVLAIPHILLSNYCK